MADGSARHRLNIDSAAVLSTAANKAFIPDDMAIWWDGLLGGTGGAGGKLKPPPSKIDHLPLPRLIMMARATTTSRAAAFPLVPNLLVVIRRIIRRISR